MTARIAAVLVPIAGALAAMTAPDRIAQAAPQRSTSLLDVPASVAAYGQRERDCQEPLTMSLPDKGPSADYAMCCQEFYEPVGLWPGDLVEVEVRLAEPEKHLTIKLEESGPVQLVVREGPVDAGVVTYRRAFSRSESKPWEINKLCVVAAGQLTENRIEVVSARIVGRDGVAAPPPPSPGSARPLIVVAIAAAGIAVLGAVALVWVWGVRRRATGATRTRRADLLTRLSQLLPSQFEEVLFRAEVPTAHLPSGGEPQATRAIDAIRYLEQHSQLPRLARTLDEVMTGPP
jgi:hypothetical protein